MAKKRLGPKAEQIPFAYPKGKKKEIKALEKKINALHAPMAKAEVEVTKTIMKLKGKVPENVAKRILEGLVSPEKAVFHCAAMYERLLKGELVKLALLRALNVSVDDPKLIDGMFVQFNFDVLDASYFIGMGGALGIYFEDGDLEKSELNPACNDCLVYRYDESLDEEETNRFPYVEIFRDESIAALEKFLKTLSPII